MKDIKKAHETNEPQATHLLYSKEDSSSPTPPPPEETVTNAQRTPDGVDPPEPVVVANPETLPSHSSEGNMSQGANALSQLLTSEDLPHQRSQYLIEGASQDDIPASLQCTQPSTRTYIAGCGPPLLQHMDPAAPNSWGSPPKTSHSFGMPLLECNERPTTTGSTSTVYPTQFDSRLHDTTGTCTIRERPQRGFQRQSSLPNPPRPRTLIPQAQQLRLNQSPQQQRPNYNTNTTTSSATTHSLTPDNDLEYRRQLQHVQQQWPCQGQPTTARMNSSDSTNSTRSRTSTTSTRTPPMDFSHSSPPLPPLEHAYIHANPPQSHMHNTVAQHQPMNAATGHHHGPRNFHRLDSRESANSVTSLTPESKPESGHQTGSMLVTGTYH